jgi:hypothetical protein
MIAYLIAGLSLEPPVPIAVRRLADNRGETMTALEYQRRRLLRGDECRRFPVHNVTLYVREMPESSRPQQFGAVGRVKLDRDATIGLGEYAPGNEVVAGGRIWTSAGVVRHSHEFMPQQSYIVCDHCQRVDIRLNYAEHPKECEQCGSRLKWMPGGRNGKFISPTGFTTSVAERKGRSPARHRLRAPGTDEARLVTMVPLNMFERTDLHSVESAFAAGCPDPDSSQLAGELFVVNKDSDPTETNIFLLSSEKATSRDS